MSGRRSLSALVFHATALCLGLPAGAGGVAVMETLVSDNGDGDGFADTRESVTLRLRVQNTTGIDLHGVVLHLTTTDPDLVCVSQPTLVIGELAAGEVRETEGGFQFVVADVDRATLGLGPHAELSVGFEILATAAGPPPGDPAVHPGRMRLDLDINVSGGAGPTTFVEGFENGMGTFEVQNLDQGHHTVASSNGYRCQYHDPGNPNSVIHNNPLFTSWCHLGASQLHADAVFWGLSGPETSPLLGRGFTGFHSLFFGRDLGPPLNWTTPLATLEAAATIEPIYLGWNGVTPHLSIKHQTSFPDQTSPELSTYNGAMDRGVVMAQVADEQDQPVGAWIKLDPFTNVYDHPVTTNSFYCQFDPIDDGSTEDDFFDPEDPEHLFGPSSTCAPETVFSRIGETSELFAEDNVGLADGPGLQGIWGPGTWIESRFDLSRFAGRRVRLRFLSSTMQVVLPPNEPGAPEDWEQFLELNPSPDDDGWWIDDVTVTGALASAASVAVDQQDNSALPGPPDPDFDAVCETADNCPGLNNPAQTDADLDGSGPPCDCNDASAATHPGAQEVNDGQDNQCPGDSGHGMADEIEGTTGFFDPGNDNAFSWPAQPGAERYQVARASAGDFSVGCVIFFPTPNTVFVDTSTVPPGEARYYLVRASLPHQGSWGQDSAGQERNLPCD